MAGIQAHDVGDFSTAREHYRRLLKHNEDHPLALYQMAFAYRAEGELKLCAEYAARSAGHPSRVRAQALGMQGACLDMAERHVEALPVFQMAVDEDPGNVLLRHSTAIVYLNLGDLAAAREELYDALKVDPLHPGSHLMLAEIRREEGERAASLLGYGYFLLLETHSGRSAMATEAIREILRPPEPEERPDGRKHVQLIVPSGGDTHLTSLETIIAISGAVRGAHHEDSGTQILGSLEIEQIARQFGMILMALPEPVQDGAPRDPLWDIYIPFFRELHADGHTTPFVYLAMQTSGLDGINEWIDANEDAAEAFIEWVNE